MDLHEFENEYLGDIPYTEKDKQLYALAQEYHERTEAYDQMVCSGSRNGVAIPCTQEEVIKINRNAKELYMEIIQRAAFVGAAKDEMHKAIFHFPHQPESR